MKNMLKFFKANKIKQTDVAEQLGITKQAMSLIMKSTNIKVRYIDYFIEKYGLSYEFVMDKISYDDYYKRG